MERWAEAKRQVTSERGFSPEVAALAIDIRRRLILALHEAGADVFRLNMSHAKHDWARDLVSRIRAIATEAPMQTHDSIAE